jgi:ATP-dependent metalloprotease
VFVGLGASRIKDLFEKAKKNSPCVIFIDEIDAVGGRRMESHSYYRLTINELLTQMDGFDNNYQIVVIGTHSNSLLNQRCD